MNPETSLRLKALAVMGIFILAFIIYSALTTAYIPSKVNTDLQFSITSNNATQCNVSTIDKPTATVVLNKILTKTGQTFYGTITKGNITTTGTYCFNIACTDGINIETGSKCFDITPSGNNNNLGFYFLVIGIIYAIAFVGFFGKNEWVTILGGMGMIALGLYSINNGVVIFRDTITDVFSWTTIGLGSFFAIYAGISVINENM